MNLILDDVVLILATGLIPLLRISALLLAAPLVSLRVVSIRIRVALAVVLTIFIYPTLELPVIDPVSAGGLMLIIALSVGLIIGVFQAATSIQEMTLSFIPKLAALVAALLIFGDWQLTILSEMFISIFDMIPQIFTR